MAKKKEVVRNYRFPDSWLITLCNRVIAFILRDILEFAAYGIVAANVDDYRDEVDAFEEYPTDIELAGTQKVKTEEKDSFVDGVKTEIRGVMARVVTVFKVGSARYEIFGTKGMDAMTDSELLKCGRRVVRMATKYLAELAATGLTAAIITSLKTKCQGFEDAIEEQELAIANRDVATEERIEIANALFEKLMNLCGFGQNIWVAANEAKYNDYIIYTKSGSLVSPIEMIIEKGTSGNITNKLFAGTDVFVLTNTGSALLKIGFCINAVTAVTAGISLSAGESKTATAAELGDFAANQFLNCTNGDAVQGSLKVKLP